jgi:hypothetical protein
MSDEAQQWKVLRDRMTLMQAEIVTRTDLQAAMQSAMKQSQSEMLKQFQELLNANNRHSNGQHDPSFNHGTNGHSFCEGGPSYHKCNSSGDGFHTRTIRLEFPHFDGEDPETWC